MARKIDTVTVEVVRNLLMSIAEETYGIIVRSAYSTNMKERRDVCTAVIDPDDAEFLSSLVLKAVQDALNGSKEMADAEMRKVTGGLGFPM